jgi:tRNA uridine 5-carboxymethylaminomethyl modification enzyme
MFTSRAEYRLQLREDNADVRLTEIGRSVGLVDDARWRAFNQKVEVVSRETERLRSTWVHPGILGAAQAERLLGKALEHEYSLAELLRRPGIGFDSLSDISEAANVGGATRHSLRKEFGIALADAAIEQIETCSKYAGYIERQIEDVRRAAQQDDLLLPAALDYALVDALSHEVRQTLSRQRPGTLGQASRLSGVTPAAISLLRVHLKKRGRRAAPVTPHPSKQPDAA